jgi:hypothetical protein
MHNIWLVGTAFTAAVVVSWSMSTFPKPKSKVEATAASTTISPAEMVERQGRNLPDIIVGAEGVDRRDRDRPPTKVGQDMSFKTPTTP